MRARRQAADCHGRGWSGGPRDHVRRLPIRPYWSESLASLLAKGRETNRPVARLIMNLFKFDSESAWVDGIASFWRDRLRTNPRLRMCLPSGHTPNAIYAAMAKAVAAGQV